LGSSLSQVSLKVMGSNVIGYFSVRDEVHLGSSISVRSFARLGSAMSIYSFAHVGSSLSLRSFVRLGSTLSVNGKTVPSTLSVVGMSNIGSSLSLRAFIRLGSSLSINGAEQFNTWSFSSNTKYTQTSDLMTLAIGGTSVIQHDSDGSGTGNKLIGSWTADDVISSSDRRLKTDIKPLRRTLKDFVKANQKQIGAEKPKGDGALWMLRQLRPVSYSFKKGAESKYMRFGFIADELETTVPQVVRNMVDKETGLTDKKGVILEDMIALLASAGQSQQEIIDTQNRLMDQVETEFEAFKTELQILRKIRAEKEKRKRENRAVACGATRKKRRRFWWLKK